MTSPDHEPTLETVRFLAWLKKRGAACRLMYCTKKWEKKGIRIKDICRGYAKEMMHVQSDPSTGDKWVVLDDLVRADNLMIAFGEEVPHHGQWIEW